MILKNIRIVLLLVFVAVSILLIGPNPFPSGYVITYVDKNSTINLPAGTVIYKINDADVTGELLQKEYYGTIWLDTSLGRKPAKLNGTLGISAEMAGATNLNFGLDIKGGILAVIEPNTTNSTIIEQISSTLQTRINLYGLRESTFRTVQYGGKGFIEISMAGGTKEEMADLLNRQGKFEAKIPFMLKVSNNQSELQLDKKYTFTVESGSISVDSQTAAEGETFTLAGISFTVDQINTSSVNLTALVYDGSDITSVYYDPQRSFVQPQSDGYKWQFAIQLRSEGAEKFARVTQNIPLAPVTPGSTERYLESPIQLYLDRNLIDSLNIASDLKGKVATEIAISGYASTMDQAKKERSKLQSVLKSGSLETSIMIVQMDTISPNLGSSFLYSAAMAGLAAVIGVVAVVFLRYRKLRIALPMSLISFSEVVIILGAYAAFKATVDLAAIAGIIAVVGTGVDAQIIMADQALRKETGLETLKEKLKRAFFIIFGAGGTVIAAMLPLLSVSGLTGFAITTIIGVLVGILITRPAFGAIVEKLIKE